MLRRAEAAAQVMEHLITHAAHGYSQVNRAGDGTTETITLSSGEKVQIHGGDYDCSEAVRMCYAAPGVLPWSYWASYLWTGNERSVLLAHGFKEVPVLQANRMQRGDVLWRDGHTELYLGGGLQGGARIDENRDIKGRQKGDQTGWEIDRSEYKPTRWTAAYRYAGPERNEQEAGDPVNFVGMTYRSHVQSIGWLDPVHDGQVSGTTGLSLRLEAIKVTPPVGVVMDITVHLQGIGDKTYTGIERGVYDPVIGTTGESRRLEGISIKLTENGTGKQLKYRAHIQESGWSAWMTEGQFAGTRGKSLRAEAIQIEMV